MKKQSRSNLRIATNISRPVVYVGIRESELRSMSKRELLGLTRALINVRDDRPVEFSVPYATPKVIRCAKKIAKMPPKRRDIEIARINEFTLKSIYQ